MITMIVMVLLSGIILVSYGVYQMKTYYGRQQFTEAQVVGYEKYNGGRGLQGMAINAVSSMVGIVYPVVDIHLADGTLKTVRLNVTVTDDIIRNQFPEFDIGGRISVTYFGDDPKIVYLTSHPMAQTVMKVSMPLLIGIALLVLSAILVFAAISFSRSF